jgi:hypothetical protein
VYITEPIVQIKNKTNTSIDSLFIGCKFLGRLAAKDSIIVSEIDIKTVLNADGVPIGKVQTNSKPCKNVEESQSFCRVYSNFDLPIKKQVVIKRLEIVWMLNGEGIQELVWRKTQ